MQSLKKRKFAEVWTMDDAKRRAKNEPTIKLEPRTLDQLLSPRPKFLAHGTTIANALSIISEGRVRGTHGVCGEGAYGFALEALDDERLVQAYGWLSEAGYNGGAVIVMRCEDAILIACNAEERVPEGCISTKKDTGRNKGAWNKQYSAGEGSVKCVLAIFNEAALVSHLGKQLLDSVYSMALTKAKESLAPASGSSSSHGAGRVWITSGGVNDLVCKPVLDPDHRGKARVFASCAWAVQKRS
jgi:hypothetical protein